MGNDILRIVSKRKDCRIGGRQHFKNGLKIFYLILSRFCLCNICTPKWFKVCIHHHYNNNYNMSCWQDNYVYHEGNHPPQTISSYHYYYYYYAVSYPAAAGSAFSLFRHICLDIMFNYVKQFNNSHKQITLLSYYVKWKTKREIVRYSFQHII